MRIYTSSVAKWLIEINIFQLDALIDTTVLPSDVMSLRDDKFIYFVKLEAGDNAAALLEMQRINCVKSLLMSSDVYSILNVKSKSLDDFRNKYGYMETMVHVSLNLE